MEELRKRMENIDLPKIELQSHRFRLRAALLNSGYFKEGITMYMLKKFAPIGVLAAVVLAVVVALTLVYPKRLKAEAEKIAKKDPQIQELMEEYGAEIRDVEVRGDKGYILLVLPEGKLLPVPRTQETKPWWRCGMTLDEKGEPRVFTSSLIKVDLRGKKVENVEPIKDKQLLLAPLLEDEITKAIEIVKKESETTKLILREEGAKVAVAVRPILPVNLRLEETDDGVIVVSEPKDDKRASVIVTLNDECHVITVDLTQGKVMARTIANLEEILEEIESESENSKSVELELRLQPREDEISRSGERKVTINIDGKNLDEFLKDAELLSEEEGFRIYRLSDSDTIEVREKDGRITVKLRREK